MVVLCCVQEAVIIGGLDMQAQAKALAQRPHVVVATPGRLRVIAIPSSCLSCSADSWPASRCACRNVVVLGFYRLPDVGSRMC